MAAIALPRNPRIASIFRPFYVAAVNTISTATASPSNYPSPPSALVDEATISGIKDAIRNESNPDHLADLFLSVATAPSFYGDRIISKLAIQKLVAACRPDLIKRLLEHQITDPFTPKSEGFLMHIISLYGDASMPDQAASTFNRIPLPRTERSLCALLNAFFKSGQHARLRETLESADAVLGVSPGIASCNLLLRSLCEDGKVAAAQVMLEEMPNRELIPDVNSYNIVLNGYFKEKNDEGFQILLREMSKKQLVANVSTYNCRIAALCSKGMISEAEELLDVMLLNGIRPNPVSFNTLIDGYCKEGNATLALRVFRRMLKMKRDDSSAASANYATCVLLLSCLIEKEEIESSLEVGKLCLSKKWAPPVHTMIDLIHGLINNSYLKEAKDVVEMMGKAVKGESIDEWRKAESEFIELVES